MEPLSAKASITASSAPITNPSIGFDPFSFIFGLFGGSETSASLFSFGGIADLFSTVWSVYVFLAFIFSGLLLALYAYASAGRWHYYSLGDQSLRDAEALYDSQVRGLNKNSRMDDIIEHVSSDNPNDWKLAIIEADIILDGILKERGYVGNSLGERLKSISSGQLSSLNDAWEAHKVRNMIAHEGPDYVLTKRMAEETVGRYRRVFSEFGIL